jgi:hypothetical protein
MPSVDWASNDKPLSIYNYRGMADKYARRTYYYELLAEDEFPSACFNLFTTKRKRQMISANDESPSTDQNYYAVTNFRGGDDSRERRCSAFRTTTGW